MRKILLGAIAFLPSFCSQENMMWHDDPDYNEMKSRYYQPTPPHVKNGRGKRKAWKK